MKTYVMTTGAVFALLVLLHVWRIVEEGASPAANPWLWIVTGVAAGFAMWSWRVLRGLPR